MQIIGIIVGAIIVITTALGIYKASTMFDLQKTFGIEKSQKIQSDFDDKKRQADAIINSGKQYLTSGAQNMIASGEALLQQKKLEAEKYILQQKEQLKIEAQKKLEEEAKKKLNGIFTGR